MTDSFADPLVSLPLLDPADGDAALVEKLLDIARDEIGLHEEQGQNCGTCLTYQRVTGNGPGDSWCLSFVIWCFITAQLKQRLPAITGSCQDFRVAAQHAGKLVVHGPPEPGDIGLLVRNADNHAHHAFLVRDFANPTTHLFPSIEGNSNDTGSDNGVGVFGLDKRSTEPGTLDHIEYVRLFDLTGSMREHNLVLLAA